MAKPLLIKTFKRILLGLIGVAVIAGMFWFVNTYVYKFYAANPTVKVDSSTTVAKVSTGNDFNVVLGFSNANIKAIDAIDLIVTYDKDKLIYQNSVSSLPVDNYFRPPSYSKITDLPNNKSQLRLILLANDAVKPLNNLTVNLKFRAMSPGTATIAVENNTTIAGTDGANKAVTYDENLDTAKKVITIEGVSNITPTVTSAPYATTVPTNNPTTIPSNPPTITSTVWKSTNLLVGSTAQVKMSGTADTSKVNVLILGNTRTVTDYRFAEKTNIPVVNKKWEVTLFPVVPNFSDSMLAYPTVSDGTFAIKANPTELFFISNPNVPTVTPSASPTATPTPPWQNTNYNTTTFYGIVQEVDENGVGIPGRYWRKDATVCANATYPSLAKMNINGNSLDKCEGFNNIPYFLTVVPNNAVSAAFLSAVPEGYECVGWEHRLRVKSDGKPLVKDEGTGCSTGPLDISVNNANSSYENSHFLLFKIKRTVEPTPTSELTKYQSVLNMKVRFQGIPEAPKVQYGKMNVNVMLKGGGQQVKKQLVEFTAQSDGVWTGSMGVDGISDITKYELLIKGPKHLTKKICANNPSEQIPGTYRCQNADINLQKGDNNLDFSNIILLGGDLPQQDGIINALDFAFVRQHLGSQNPDDLARGDINLDGIIDTQDHTIIKTALEFKYDEE
jgi:hypothetical protein